MNYATLENLFGWGYLDIKKLDDLLYTCSNWSIEVDDLEQLIGDFAGDTTNLNDWIYACIHKLFYTIFYEVEKYIKDKKLLQKIEHIKDNFDPYVNYMDSWFNNFLDEINLDDDPEEVIKEIIKYLKNN
jgi:hypothetical protein